MSSSRAVYRGGRKKERNSLCRGSLSLLAAVAGWVAVNDQSILTSPNRTSLVVSILR